LCYRSIRVIVRTTVLFNRLVENGIQHVTANFTSHPQLVTSAEDYDFDQLLSELEQRVEDFNARGSGFVFELITAFTLVITQYRPLAGSSYLPTPQKIAKKQAVINVKNSDNRCFQWAILSYLHPPKNHPCDVYSYRKYENTLNFEGISFPVQIKDIAKFEKQNIEISVNVISLDPDNDGYCIERLSSEHDRLHNINLLLIHDSESETKHYVWIKNMSRFVCGRTKHDGKSFVCNSCLNVFSTQQVLDSHVPYCLNHAPQQVVYPDPEDCKLKFKDHDKEFKIPIYLTCDFESFLVPADPDPESVSKTVVIDEHQVSGFCCYRVCQPNMSQYETPPTVYSGPNVMDRFYEHIISESEIINSIISQQLPLLPMSTDELKQYRAATKCANCNCFFSRENYRVRHHSHLNGEFLFAACNNCNLQLKPKRSKNDYLLPVILHNLKCYDSHFIIKHFQRQYTRLITKHQKITYDDVRIIPLNQEKYLQFQIGNLRFMDSFQFLSASLDHLVSLLLKSGKENFQHTAKYMGDAEFLFQKGVFPYSYFTDRSKFQETHLPPIENFYNTLNDEPLSVDDYERAHKIWNFYNIQNLQEYHDHYLKSDVLLLTDVFENFRNSVYDKHGLDCLYFPTLPSLAWSMALKHTKVELDLITDSEAYLMIENAIRGGISTIANRYSKANNPLTGNFDPSKPTTFITYLDMNNLYGAAQSDYLPVGDFNFLSADDVSKFDLMAITENSPIGYIVECDLEYPTTLHDNHSDYPLAPEHLTVASEMLSPFVQNLIRPGWKPTKKLIPNLYNKTKYVTHYRNLQFYINHGLIVTKIHRILSFKQSTWLKSWIDMCTTQRQNAESEFEADLAKLQANSTFGKTMEQVRNRVNIRLIADPKKLTKAVSKPSYREARIINPDLVMVRAARQKVLLNKPIAVGFCVLELSKLLMYRFYYDYLKPKYGDRCSLLFTDTDSLCCQIETQDLYHDMSKDMDLFDTSNFDQDHYLYSKKNHRVLGKMKSETGSTPPDEFVGLRAKMYSLTCGKKSHKKIKGIKKNYSKKHVQHESFLNVLRNASRTTNATFRIFRSTNHILNTLEISKTCLSAVDDKRYILEDGIRTLAYGHYSTL